MRWMSTRVFVATALVVTGLGVAGVGPVAAAPSLTVTPTVVDAGGTVTVVATDLVATDQFVIAVCPRSYAEGSGDHSAADRRCAPIGSGDSGSGGPVSVDVAVPDRNVAGDGQRFTCSATPDGCALAVYNELPFETVNFLWAAVTIHPPPGPALTVDPWPVASRGVLSVGFAGFPAGSATVAVCPVSIDEVPSDEAPTRCLLVATFPGGLPSGADLTAPSQITVGSQTSDCTAGGCSVAAFVSTGSGPTAAVTMASVPIAVDPPPVTVTPQRNVVDGGPVRLNASGLTPGPATIQQCAGPPSTSQAGCTSPRAATVGAAGTLVADVPVTTAFEAADGTDQRCAARCWLRLGTADGPLPYAVEFGFGAPSITFSNPLPLPPDPTLDVDIGGFPGTDTTVLECALPLGADIASSNCVVVGYVTLDAAGAGSGQVFGSAEFQGSQSVVDCQVSGCALVGVEGLDGEGPIVASVPVTFVGGSLTITPSSGLREGDVMQVHASGLSSGPYVVLRCGAGTGPLTAAASTRAPPRSMSPIDGVLDTTLVATSRLTTEAVPAVLRSGLPRRRRPYRRRSGPGGVVLHDRRIGDRLAVDRSDRRAGGDPDRYRHPPDVRGPERRLPDRRLGGRPVRPFGGRRPDPVRRAHLVRDPGRRCVGPRHGLPGHGGRRGVGHDHPHARRRVDRLHSGARRLRPRPGPLGAGRDRSAPTSRRSPSAERDGERGRRATPSLAC